MKLLRFATWSLRGKILALLLVASFLPVAVAATIALVQARTAVVEQTTLTLQARAEQLAGELDAFHRNYRGIARRFALRPAILALVREGRPSSGDPRADVVDLLDSLPATDQHILGVGVLDAQGTVLYSSIRSAIGQSYRHRPYFQPMATASPGSTVVSDLFLAGPIANSAPGIVYAAPIHDDRGAFAGGFVLMARATAFWDIATDANGRAGAGSYAVVLDGRGIRIAHSFRSESVFHPTADVAPALRDEMIRAARFGERTRALLEGPIRSPELHELATNPRLSDTTGVLRIFGTANDKVNLAVAHRMREAPWTVVVLTPEDQAYAIVEDLLRRSLSWAALIIVLAGLAGLWLSRRILQPVRDLARASEAIGEGNLLVRVPVTTEDEVGQLGGRFNQMAHAIEEGRTQLEARVETRTQELQRANEELRAQRAELRAQQQELAHKNQEVERADRLKSDFLANMSHELRTPLNSIIGFSELLQDEGKSALSERHRQFLGDVLDSGRHLLGLINDILDLSKIEAGKLVLEPAPIAPADAIAEACQLVAATANKRRVNLARKPAADTPVLADPPKLRQILLNLLSNAVKFSPEGGEVGVGADELGDLVRFWVRDRGPGIDAGLKERLFQPFVQGESALVKRHQGTGLGLSICKRLVEKHGGTIEVQSTPGLGSVFQFTLPKARTTADEAHAGPPVGVPNARPIGGADDPTPLPVAVPIGGAPPRVLVIDDDPHVGALLRDVLEPAGYRITIAVTGALGIEASEREPFDLCIVDLGLPDMTGDQVIERLVARPGHAGPPIIVLSGQELRPERREALARHVRLFATKGDLLRGELLAACRRLTDPSERRRRREGSILVIDDHDMNRELARTILERKGYEVLLAADGASGLELARTRRPGLIFMDMAMPKIDGYTATRALKGDLATRDIPVVALTALAMRGDEKRAYEAGVEAYLTKPIDREQMERTVDQLMRQEPSQP